MGWKHHKAEFNLVKEAPFRIDFRERASENIKRSSLQSLTPSLFLSSHTTSPWRFPPCISSVPAIDMKTGPILGLASLAVASAIIPRDILDNPYGKATCGISGQSDQLDAYDLRWATESFAEDIPSLVDENQKFTGKISVSRRLRPFGHDDIFSTICSC